MKYKDKEFDLFGTRFKLTHVDKIETENKEIFTSGSTNSAAHEIKIALKDYNGNIVDSNDYTITLLHELIHAILDQGQYSSCSSDEPLVEWLARCLKSLKDQKII